MKQSPKLLHLIINLEHSTERRALVERQAEQWGLDLHFIKAIAGKDLDMDHLEGYDRERRMRAFTSDLLPNEHACVQSHLKAMREFMASDCDYCLISEDDVLYSDTFKSRLEFLLTRTSGWEFVKLFSGDCLRYAVLPGQQGNPAVLEFPKKFPWGSVSNLYTRRAVEALLEGFKGYWMGFDVQAAQICLAAGIPCCGVTPDMADTSFRSNEVSEIDAEGARRGGRRRPPRSLAQYMRHRLFVWSMARGKQRMRSLLSRCLKVERD